MSANPPKLSDYFTAIDNANGPSSPPGYHLLSDSNGGLQVQDASTGFVAATYVNNNTNQIVIAFQGQAPTGNIGALTTDASILQGQVPANFLADISSFLTRSQNAAISSGLSFDQSNVFVTGNSAGGYAAEVAAQNGFGGASFGAPGIQGYSSPSERTSNFINYVNNGDSVGNYATDTGVNAGISGPADHFGTVALIGPQGPQDTLRSKWEQLAADNSAPNEGGSLMVISI